MSKIELIRVDFRMIHGQVIVKWLKKTGANKIIAVNDAIAVDPFLADIYQMAAPAGVKIETMTRDDASRFLAADDGSKDRYLVLIKSVEDAYYCWKQGMPMPHLQIGGLGAGPNRVNVFGAVTLDDADASLLNEMNNQGVDVYFHLVPDESKAKLDKILAKYHFNLDTKAH